MFHRGSIEIPWKFHRGSMAMEPICDAYGTPMEPLEEKVLKSSGIPIKDLIKFKDVMRP